MKKQFTNITEIYNNSNMVTPNAAATGTLGSLNRTFSQLEQLNRILAKLLPSNLVNTCHVGAIDYRKNIVVIFVSNQMAAHLLRNLTNEILQGFAHAHYSFDQLLMRIGQYSNTP